MMSIAKNKVRVLFSKQEAHALGLVQPLNDFEDLLDNHWSQTH